MRKVFFFFLLFPFFLFFSNRLFAQWKNVAEGIDYQRSESPFVHAFRVDLKKVKLDLLIAKELGANSFSSEDYRQRTKALLVINGGFFDENFHSLGLRQKKNNVLNPVRNSTWGIFVLGGKDGKTPAILSRKDWKPELSTLALQVGPRLVIDGQVPSFKEGSPTRRSAMGITPDGKIEIALSESPLTLREWAEWLKKDCPQVLNLDGGGSSQVSVNSPHFSLQVMGATTVPDAIALFPNDAVQQPLKK
ncbi:MAG: phosphodiester glycosidase family protein [Deltaproteobacteria bacterium]|nr:phosphodiester glycosidase family protein [Deltaproteobacteria bacterium]